MAPRIDLLSVNRSREGVRDQCRLRIEQRQQSDKRDVSLLIANDRRFLRWDVCTNALNGDSQISTSHRHRRHAVNGFEVTTHKGHASVADIGGNLFEADVRLDEKPRRGFDTLLSNVLGKSAATLLLQQSTEVRRRQADRTSDVRKTQ